MCNYDIKLLHLRDCSPQHQELLFQAVCRHGVRVSYKGIIRKTMLIDADVLCIGTVNLNFRSLERRRAFVILNPQSSTANMLRSRG